MMSSMCSLVKGDVCLSIAALSPGSQALFLVLGGRDSSGARESRHNDRFPRLENGSDGSYSTGLGSVLVGEVSDKETL